MSKVINAGKYNKKIKIIEVDGAKDSSGFPTGTQKTILSTFASLKTTKGFTLIANNTDFEKAYTNFTIRYPKTTITRDMLIKFNGKLYSIEYLNNVDADLNAGINNYEYISREEFEKTLAKRRIYLHR